MMLHDATCTHWFPGFTPLSGRVRRVRQRAGLRPATPEEAEGAGPKTAVARQPGQRETGPKV